MSLFSLNKMSESNETMQSNIYPFEHIEKETVKPLPTIIIGFRCADGVVVASDSQSEFGRGVDVKRLNTNKIYTLDENRYIIAGAGTVAHIRALADNIQDSLLQQRLRQRSELNKDETESVVERTLWVLVKHYNIDRSNALCIAERDYYQPIAVFAGSSKNPFDNNIEYYVNILHGGDGTIESIADYGAAGSGAAYAELHLKSLYDSSMTVAESCILSNLSESGYCSAHPCKRSMGAVYFSTFAGSYW